jgi:hypothetical protein
VNALEFKALLQHGLLSRPVQNSFEHAVLLLDSVRKKIYCDICKIVNIFEFVESFKVRLNNAANEYVACYLKTRVR